MKFSLPAGLVLAGVVSLSLTARAQQAFDFTFSGVPLGNLAVATGTITLNPNVLSPSGYNDNSGFFFPPANPFATALSITISGASSGNGTFVLSDFNTILFDQNGGNLDFTRELVGQPTSGSPFGTPGGGGGDFNLFNRNGVGGAAPDGRAFFQLTTDAGTETPLTLTSFRPASAVPEPGSIALLVGLGVSGLGFLSRRRQQTHKAA